jgi:7-keto-8-aminopelargonate synthetase-like enzyme
LTKTKTKRPDYKKELDALKAAWERNAKDYAARMTACVNSNNGAVADLSELVKLHLAVTTAQTALDQAFAVISKKLREVRSPGSSFFGFNRS